MAVREGNTRVCIVLDEEDQKCLDYLCVKLGLKPTQVYRLAIRAYCRQEKKVA